MASRATKSEHVGMDMFEVRVRAVRHLTPHLKRITLADDALRGFRDDGPDQRFKLLLPRPGQDRPRIPTPDDGWYAEWKAMAPDERPVMRTYTVADARPHLGELDVDMIVHGHGGGPGSSWAGRAAPGDRVALYAAWAEYEVDPAADQLIAGDLSAVPAIGAILRRMPAEARARVLIETAPADRLELATDAAVRIDWIDALPGEPGAALRRAVSAATAERLPDYAWVAADQATVARIRRHLVRQRGLAPEQVMFMGYWRTDGAIDPD